MGSTAAQTKLKSVRWRCGATTQMRFDIAKPAVNHGERYGETYPPLALCFERLQLSRAFASSPSIAKAWARPALPIGCCG